MNENSENLGTSEKDAVDLSSDDENGETNGQAQDPIRSNRLSNLPPELNFDNDILVTIDNNHVDDQHDNFQWAAAFEDKDADDSNVTM